MRVLKMFSVIEKLYDSSQYQSVLERNQSKKNGQEPFHFMGSL